MDTNDLVRRLNLSVTIRCSEQPPKPMLDTTPGIDLHTDFFDHVPA